VIYRFDAALFFANAPRLRDEIVALVDDGDIHTVIIDMESVDDIDSTGAQALRELLDELDRRNVGLELARVRTEIRDELTVAAIESRLAGGTVYLQVDDAVTAVLGRGGDQPGAPRRPLS
jgi:SulP family sulfate permease